MKTIYEIVTHFVFFATAPLFFASQVQAENYYGPLEFADPIVTVKTPTGEVVRYPVTYLVNSAYVFDDQQLLLTNTNYIKKGTPLLGELVNGFEANLGISQGEGSVYVTIQPSTDSAKIKVYGTFQKETGVIDFLEIRGDKNTHFQDISLLIEAGFQ